MPLRGTARRLCYRRARHARHLPWLTWVTGTVLVFYAPLLFGRALFLKDAQLVFYPLRLALRERLMAGDLPEWLPELDLGLPFLANPTHAALYPLNLILLLPAPYCVGWFVVAHALGAALGGYFLLMALGVRPSASALGALCFALGGYMVSLTWGTDYMLGLAWLPWVARSALMTVSTGRTRHACVTALVWGCQILCGEPQAVMLTGWLVLTLVLSAPGSGRERLARLGLLGVSVALATSVAMPQILPPLELLPQSRRASGLSLAEASHWSLHPLRLFELCVPWLFGNPLDFDQFLGFFMDDEDSSFHRDPWLVTPYWSSLGLVLALLGASAPRRRQLWWVRGVLVLTTLALLLALGRHTPVFGAYFAVVPGASLFRYPAKFFGLCAATLPLLAAAGAEAWLGERRRGRWLMLMLSGLLGLLLLGLGVSGWVGQELAALRPIVGVGAAVGTVRRALASELLLLALLAVLVGWCWRRAAVLRAPVLLGAVTLQLGLANWAAYETVTAAVYSRTPVLAERMLERNSSAVGPRVMVDVVRLDLPGLDSAPGQRRAEALAASLMKNTGIIHGISYARAYVSSGELTKHRLWQESPYRRQLLDIFGVRYLVLAKHVPVSAASGLEALANMGEVGAAVYENRSALPFAYAVGGVLPVASQAEATGLLGDARVARGQLAVVELPQPGSPQPMGRVGGCRAKAPPKDRVELQCQLARAGWVVVNASYHPGWKAWVDAVPVLPLRANALVMALPVPAGTHVITLEYSEPSLGLGFSISALGLLLMALLALRERSRAAG